MLKDRTDLFSYYEDIVETIREPLLALDSDLVIISANRNFYDTFKAIPKKTIGRLIYDLGNKQWDIPKLRTLLEEILPKENKFNNYEVDHVFPNIGHKIMLLNARRITHKGIGSQLILLAIEDITERKRLEDVLKDSEESYRRIFETANEGILLLEKSKGNITQVNPAAIKMFGYSEKKYVGSKLKDVGFPHDLGDIQEILHTLDREGIIHYNDIPVKTKAGKTIDTDTYLVDRASWVQCNIRDITDRKKAEETLINSEALFKGVTAAVPVGLGISSHREIQWTNDYLLQMLGRQKEEIIGHDSRIFYASDEEYSKVGKVFYEALRIKSRAEIETVWKNKDGRVMDILLTGTALNQEDSASKLIFGAIDITERKRAQEEIKSLGKFPSENPFPVLRLSQDGIVLYANEAGQALVRDWGGTVDRHMPTFYRGLITAALTNQSRRTFDLQLGKQTYSFVIAPVLDASYVNLYGHDITDRKRVENTLKESEHKYRLLADNINDVIFVLDMNMKYTYVSPSVKILRGYEPEEVLKQQPLEILTPSSMDLAMRTLSKVMELEKSGQREINDISRTLQLEMKRKDGTTVWTEVKFSFIRDENQQPIAILGLTRDITERRKEEERILLSEKRFKTLYQESPISTFTWQKKGDNFFLIDFNNAAVRLTEGKASNYMGKNALEMYRQRPEIIDEMLRCYKEQCIINRELISQDFTPGRHLSIYYSYIPPDLVIAHAMDITERRRAEEDLKQSFEQTRKALGATVHAIAFLVETRDPYTAGHQRRVADLARTIATEMRLTSDQIDGIRMAGTIHDIGKIAIPAEILSTPKKLTDIEFSLIKTHSQSGYDILKDIDFPWPVARIVLEHHERMNGSGYPNGLKGDQSLLESRIISVSDVVEAMASHRPYRPGLGIEAALVEITKNKSILYDPDVVDACLKLFQEKKYEMII